MNTQKMLDLANFIEKVPAQHFNMEYFGEQTRDGNRRTTCPEDLNLCGTTCCIAGYVVINKGLCVSPGGFVYKDLTSNDVYIGMAEQLAGEELDLTDRQAADLFFSYNWPKEFFDWNIDIGEDPVRTVTPQQAAARIRHMVATGE